MTRPRISIVTVCLNSESFVAEAIESVGTQSVSGLEHIVIDGGSSDQTLTILKAYPHLRIVSEPDDGVYDAMNKGIGMARGEFIGIVNSDDRLAPGALGLVLDAFDRQEADMITGSARYIDAAGKEIGDFRVGGKEMSPLSILLGIPMINARFFRRESLIAAGRLRTDLGPAGDREFLLRILHGAMKRHWVEETVYEYRSHKGSETINASPETRAYIWSRHVALADTLLAEEARPRAHKDALVALRQVERLKLSVHGSWRANSGGDGARIESPTAPTWRAWAALPRHLWAWYSQRGRHCGY